MGMFDSETIEFPVDEDADGVVTVIVDQEVNSANFNAAEAFLFGPDGQVEAVLNGSRPAKKLVFDLVGIDQLISCFLNMVMDAAKRGLARGVEFRVRNMTAETANHLAILMGGAEAVAAVRES